MQGAGFTGTRSLTISLDHMAAVVADIPEELWTEWVSNSCPSSGPPQTAALGHPPETHGPFPPGCSLGPEVKAPLAHQSHHPGTDSRLRRCSQGALLLPLVSQEGVGQAIGPDSGPQQLGNSASLKDGGTCDPLSPGPHSALSFSPRDRSGPASQVTGHSRHRLWRDCHHPLCPDGAFGCPAACLPVGTPWSPSSPGPLHPLPHSGHTWL